MQNISISAAAQAHFRKLLDTQEEGTNIRVFVVNPGTPNAGQIVQRVKNTPTQRGLTPGERAHKVTDAFALNEKMSFPYQRVALIDDVITTGATLNSLSQLLRQAGVQHIQVWGLARA